MGLEAFVRCNCFAEGKTTMPPVSVKSLFFDSDGYLDICRTENMTDEVYYKLSNEVYIWTQDCCTHKGMNYCNERIGNWASVRFLQQTLVSIGSELFAVLISSIPSGNGGCVDASLAEKALNELQTFKNKVSGCFNYFLVDARTEQVIYEYIEAYDGEFLWHGKTHIYAGFDKSGFFVVDTKNNHEIFRSMYFSQKKINRWFTKDCKILLTDLRTGKKIYMDSFIGSENHKELKVVTHSLKVEDFCSIDPLEKLFIASIETGNPVCWS